eukprot:253368-Chlamydomonas_euryale.AAC.1
MASNVRVAVIAIHFEHHSAQRSLGRPASCSIARTFSTNVLFSRSADPFCCGEYGAVVVVREREDKAECL